MSSRAVWSLLARLNHRPTASVENAPSDAELIARYLRNSDAAAFELIVWRHGGLVLSTCRRILRDHHTSEDAFQATFLILAKKAGSVRPQAPLAGWLHAVARRVCLRLKKRVAFATEATLERAAPESSDPLHIAEWKAILECEIARLPEKLRLAVVLCYLQGRTAEETGALLRIPRGTVLSRLDLARKKLKVRLTLRGVAPAYATGLLLTGWGTQLSACPELVERCCRLGADVLNRTVLAPTLATSLAYEVMTMNFRIALASGFAALVVTAGLGTGVGFLANGAEPPESATVPLTAPKPTEKKPMELPKKPTEFTAFTALDQKKPYDALGSVVVHSTIQAVATHTPDLGLILVSTAKLPNDDYFGVVLTQKVLDDLKRLGITDVEKHFRGAELAVEGKLTAVMYYTFPAHEMVYVQVDHLDQIRSVTRDAVQSQDKITK